MPDNIGLSDQERAELEELRAEKAAREAAEAKARSDAADRAELEALRRDRQQSEAEREAQERARQMMEPDEDLNMPVGQKIVIVAVVAVALVWLLITVIG